MTSKIDKPYVLRVAELIYSKIIEIKKQNPEVNNIQAFEIFMTTKDYDFIDKITGKKINEETLRLLDIQKESMIKFLLKIPKLYYTKTHFPLELSQRAFNHLWRVCESYEMWCKETKQKNLIKLNLID